MHTITRAPETMADTLARVTSDAAACAQIRADRRANVRANRRSRAAAALDAAGLGAYAAAIRDASGAAPEVTERALVEARRALARLEDTEEHGTAARVALDALGTLWAVIP